MDDRNKLITKKNISMINQNQNWFILVHRELRFEGDDHGVTHALKREKNNGKNVWKFFSYVSKKFSSYAIAINQIF